MNVYDWLPASARQAQVDHHHFVEVVFKARRTSIYRNRSQLPVRAGSGVVVTAPRGVDYGQVTLTGRSVQLRTRSTKSSGTIIRLATDRDVERYEINRLDEEEALAMAQQSVRRRGLPMKVVDAEWQFDRKRISFYYVAERRNLDLKKLIGEFIFRYKKHHARVELRRLSPRREAARVGGIGVCGRELCCSSWMQSFPRVPYDHARKQLLPLNPERLYGRCNQLKCCLNYELDHYLAALKDFPRINARVQTPAGIGFVDKVDIFARTVLVDYKEEQIIDDVPVEDVEVLPRKKRQRPPRRK